VITICEKSHISLFFFEFQLLISLIILSSSSQSSLTLTVTTNKQFYYLSEVVKVSGNLTLDEVPIPNALVGLEVTNPDKTIIIRTLPTGPSPQQNWLVEVLEVTPCDEYGNPKETFQKGVLSYFNVTIRNNDIEDRLVLITVNLYDTAQTPIGLSTLKGVINENSTSTIILSVPIPQTAMLGNATVYANVYSSSPKIGGKPYGPEKSAQLQIVSSFEGELALSTHNSEVLNGNFTASFRLPPYDSTGIYHVYVTCTYQGYTAINSTTFLVKVPGDADNNSVVDGSDLALLGYSWFAKPGDPHWNENCDFDLNGIIDGGDLGLMGVYWGYGL